MFFKHFQQYLPGLIGLKPETSRDKRPSENEHRKYYKRQRGISGLIVDEKCSARCYYAYSYATEPDAHKRCDAMMQSHLYGNSGS
ncbi:MAG: hypothetical protein PHS31_08910 [Victivallaceae bacterium]|nr:hypothetical protein [Victivallaceae bacterium]